MKKIVSLFLALVLSACCLTALAETGVAYGVYQFEGEHPDSLIRASVEVTDGKVTSVRFDEKLLPVTAGAGAAGWAEGAASVTLDGLLWTVGEENVLTNEEKGEFLAYVTTAEGGEWYFAQQTGVMTDAAGTETVLEIGTKESIGHGVGFWPSELKFPGNIAAIENCIVENGVDYTLDQMVKGEDGVWVIADAVSGATLAGAPNYFLLAQQAAESAK